VDRKPLFLSKLPFASIVKTDCGTAVAPIGSKQDRSDLVKRILESRDLTLSQVARESRARHRDSRCHIPHQLYANLRVIGFTPKIQQILVFSAITGYRPADWLTIFGFRLDVIPRLQATLPAKRTHLIDATIYDEEESIPWFADATPRSGLPGIVPLGRLVSSGPFQKAVSFVFAGRSPFLYAKVGWQDAFAYPDVLPSSIVRVDTRTNKRLAMDNAPKAILLVEHATGFSFCRLHSDRPGYIVVGSSGRPYPQVELELERQARILGVADLELRPLLGAREPDIPAGFWLSGTGSPLSPISAKLTFGQRLTTARGRSGLSFREASELSRRVATELKDERYFCAPGALSDYETRDDPPRHVHKLITLAILYSLKFWEVAAPAGEIADVGKYPLPEALLSRSDHGSRLKTGATVEARPGFLRDLARSFEEIPIFLRESLATLVGLPALSLRDIYWMGGERTSSHPQLKTTVLAAVDRRQKRPFDLPRRALTDQPLYMLLLRENGYLAAACHQEGELLVAHPFSDGFRNPQRFRNGIDAEVVGRIVAILRWLP